MSVRRKGRDMSFEPSNNIDLPAASDAAPAISVSAAELTVAMPPKETPRKRYAAPSAPRVMQFMRAPADKA